MDTNDEVYVPEKSKKTKRTRTVKKKEEKLKFDIPKVKKGKIYSSRSKYLELLSTKTKLQFIKRRVDEIQELPDYQKIHKLLNTPRKKSQRNPCPWPDDQSSSTVFWNTCPYLIREIDKCILTNDWNNLTRGLIAFKNAPKQYHSYLFKASLLNFMLNPASAQFHLLEDFLTEGMGCQNIEEMAKVITSQFTIPSIQIVEENKTETTENINNSIENVKVTKNVNKETKNVNGTKKVKSATKNLNNTTENVKNATENVQNSTENVLNSIENVKNVIESIKNVTKNVKISNKNVKKSNKNVKNISKHENNIVNAKK